jgi:hypothetical protein
MPKYFENYPLSTVFVTSLVTLVQYLIGLFILYLVWPWLAVAFLVYLLFLELSFYREGCKYCYYHGKRCAFGRGVLARHIVKKGNPKRFCEKKITTKDLLPQMLVLAFIVAGGAWLLYLSWSWLVLGLMIVPFVVWFGLNPTIYGKLACAHCKQGKKCCPALEFFGKGKK